MRRETPRCTPAGDLGRPRLEPYYCSTCPAVLWPQGKLLRGRLDDWAWVDEQGQETVDNRPELLKADPKAWWDQLARVDVGAYSNMKARFELVGNPFWHHHTPSRYVDPEAGARNALSTPVCCERPMYAGFEGWYCRDTKQLFYYTDVPDA